MFAVSTVEKCQWLLCFELLMVDILIRFVRFLSAISGYFLKLQDLL